MAVPTPDKARRPDVGLSHVALLVRDVDTSIAFYARYAGLEVVHRRSSHGRQVAWLSDLARPFALVLLGTDHVEGRLEGFAHLGVGCASRGEVDRLSAQARADGLLIWGPEDSGQPVGYSALLRDPDGHNLEISFGQQVGSAVEDARSAGEDPAAPKLRCSPPSPGA